MTLQEFLEKAGKGAASRLAKKIGVPASNVSMWKHKKQKPSGSKCKAIESATLGAVTRKELRPDIFG